jgi:endonuclease IV
MKDTNLLIVELKFRPYQSMVDTANMKNLAGMNKLITFCSYHVETEAKCLPSFNKHLQECSCAQVDTCYEQMKMG